MAKKSQLVSVHLLQAKLAEDRFRPTVFPPSIAEPDQSLSIEEIMRNVVATGQTGLPTGLDAEYDDDNNDDFDDPTLDPGLTIMEATDILQDTKSRYHHSIKQIQEANWRRQYILKNKRLPEEPPAGHESAKADES